MLPRRDELERLAKAGEDQREQAKLLEKAEAETSRLSALERKQQRLQYLERRICDRLPAQIRDACLRGERWTAVEASENTSDLKWAQNFADDLSRKFEFYKFSVIRKPVECISVRDTKCGEDQEETKWTETHLFLRVEWS